MNEFKFYGEENTENDDAVQLREQQAEKEAEKERKYKKHSVLDNTALFLFIVLIAENTILFATRIFFQEEMYAKAMPFFMELFILVLGAGIFSAYRYIYHSLTITNMKAIIITEAVLIVGEFIVYNFCVPVLLWFLIALSVAFIIYAVKFLNCNIFIRLAMCLVPIAVLLVCNIICLRSFEFTPRYVYISTSGYSDKTNDESNFYYKEPINTVYADALDEYVYSDDLKDNAIDEIINLTDTVSGTLMGIRSTKDTYDSLNYLNEIYSKVMPMGDVINVDNRYNDEFFKKYSLYLCAVELDNKDDTVVCTNMYYSERYTSPHITYCRSKENSEDNEKAVCIIIYEVPVMLKQRFIQNSEAFRRKPHKSDTADTTVCINYCNDIDFYSR